MGRATARSSPGHGQAAAAEPVNRERIVQVATMAFLDRGYPAVGMRELADRLGITAGALYRHFTSKEEVLLAVLERHLARFLEQSEAALRLGSPSEQLAAFIGRHVAARIDCLSRFRSSGGAASIPQLMRHLSEDQRVRVDALRASYSDDLRAILREGRRRGEFELVGSAGLTSTALLTMCDEVGAWYQAGGPYGPEEIAEAYAALALRMAGRGARPDAAPSGQSGM